jgi:protein involved in polysaccharide export with SLBB domain
MKSNIFIILIICAALAISSCASSRRLDADALSSKPENAALNQHRIAPGDTIHVTIWEVDQPKEFKVQVKNDGTIDLMFMIGLKVIGLTEVQLNDYLAKEVSTYYVNPRLTASLSPVIYLLGEVKTPGAYELDKGQTLVSVLAVAGGPTRAAKLRNTLIIRGDYNNDPTVIVANASRILKKGDLSENVVLQSGDIIYVPSTVISDVNYFITQIKPILDVFLLGTVLGL